MEEGEDAFYDALEVEDGMEGMVVEEEEEEEGEGEETNKYLPTQPHPGTSQHPPPIPPRPTVTISETATTPSPSASPVHHMVSKGIPSEHSLDLSVHLHHPDSEDSAGEEGELRLSRYRASAGSSHPLAGLEGQRAGEGELTSGYVFSDSVSEVAGSESLVSSLGGLSAALSFEGGGGSEMGAGKVQKIKVKCKKKTKSEFSHLHLIQELSLSAHGEGASSGSGLSSPKSMGKTSPLGGGSSSALYAVRFSPDGNYLAVAGDEGTIRIWKLLVEDIMGLMITESSSAESVKRREGSSSSLRYVPPRQAAIFQRGPCQVLYGHEEAVLDICWSKNNFLLSASMDKTVRLWHFSRNDCLGLFRHPDFVTSVAFNPRDDRIFITGSLDCRLRLWSIADKAVKAWNELPALNYITAVTFSNTGRRIYAGTCTGVCLIFDTEGLIYTSQIHVHSRSGKNRIGKKITGIDTMPGLSGDEKILISSNDSRVRLYTLQDKTVVSKYIGLVNQTSQIRASFSDDGEYIISGSEDHRVVIWSAENRHRQARGLLSRTPTHHVKSCEYFQAHSTTVTAVVFAPSAVRNRLQSVGLRPVLGSGESEEGQIIVAVDLNGRIKVYENNSLLEEWLTAGAPQ